MNKFKFYFIVSSLAVTLFSCNKDDSHATPPRDYAVQDATDMATIEDFLAHHYLSPVVTTDDTEVTMPLITDATTQPSIKSYLDNPGYPKLLFKNVELHDITYKVYYLKLREDYSTGKSPSKVDKVLASYNGSYLGYTSKKVGTETIVTLNNTQFEYIPFPEGYIRLDTSIKGWSEIFPLFKSGTVQTNTEPNPVSYSDFGAGVIFIPSGLGYFNIPGATIPAYSPLIFSFKLYNVALADQDGDGIYSNDEDLNHDGNFTVEDDDTDGDGIMDYLDIDDDGDGKFTKNEIRDADGNIIIPYPHNTAGLPNYLNPLVR